MEKRVELTAREQKIVDYLKENVDVILERDTIIEACFPPRLDYTNVVDVHVRSIRQKRPELKIQTIRGEGYRLNT